MAYSLRLAEGLSKGWILIIPLGEKPPQKCDECNKQIQGFFYFCTDNFTGICKKCIINNPKMRCELTKEDQAAAQNIPDVASVAIHFMPESK